MAQLRVIALIWFGALAACRQTAEAGSGSAADPSAPTRITAPLGWRALPDLATAVRTAAKSEQVTVEGSEAWGELAMGCYGAWLSLRGAGAAPTVLAQQVLDSLAAEPDLAGIAIREVVKPAEGADRGTLALAFTRATYQGRLRAQLDRSGRITALACFWNAREPGACEAVCTGLVGKLP